MNASKVFADKWRIFAIVLLLVLAGCLLVRYSSITVDLNRTKDASDAFKDFAEVVAIAGGAIWAFFKFRKGRTYQETLGVKISGRFISFAGVSYLSIVAYVKNIGLSNVHVAEEGTGIALWKYKYLDKPTGILSVEKELIGGIALVEKKTASTTGENIELFSLEPNESISFERLVVLQPPLELAVKIELQVCSTGEFQWQADTIVQEAGTRREDRKDV